MTINKNIEKEYPIFYKTCLHLQKTSFFYRDIFAANEQIPINYTLAEKMCSDAFAMCHSDWNEYIKKLTNLLEMNVEFLKLQASLEKNGKYLYSSFEEVEKEVFKKKKQEETEGVDYLWGLFFTEIFWVTHHRLFNFFLKEFVSKSPPEGICLDAPVGSGIFLSNFLSINKEWKGTGVDLSDTAIDLAKQLFEINKQSNRVELIKEDINKYKYGVNFDRIICVEFLEHVENPLTILKKLKGLLADDGKVFLTTVAWAAHINHIYLYRSAEEIRNHIARGGFKIEKEYVQNIFPKDAGKLEERNIALNYSAILIK